MSDIPAWYSAGAPTDFAGIFALVLLGMLPAALESFFLAALDAGIGFRDSRAFICALSTCFPKR